MKYYFQFLIIISLFLKASIGIAVEDAAHLSKWRGLLEKGNEKERKLALLELPNFLRYPAIQDKTIFDPILKALKDNNPSIRATAAASLKKFGRFHSGYIGEKEGIVLLGKSAEKYPQHKKVYVEGLSYHEARNLIVSYLLKALPDNEPKVREEVTKALAFYKNEDTTNELIKSLRDKDPWIRLNAVYALGELRTVKAVDPLLKLLDDNSDWRNKFVQQECVKAIIKIGSSTPIGLGSGAIRKTPEIRHPNNNNLTPGTTRREPPGPSTKIGGFDDETTAKVISVLVRKSDDPYLRALIIGAFAQFKAMEAKEILLRAKEDSDEKIRKLALDALLQISAIPPKKDLRIKTEPDKKYSEDMLDILKKSMKDSSPKVRADTVAALGKSGDERTIDLLIGALRDHDRTVIKNAIKGLGQFRDEKILDCMLSFLGKSRGYLDDTEHLAKETFMSVAEKTKREWAFIYRRDNLRVVRKDTFDVPKGAKISQRMVHPNAVGKLLNFLDRAGLEGKLSALNLFRPFEDKRIERVLLQFLNDPSPHLRSRAISLVPRFSDNTVVPRLIDASKDKDSSVRKEAVRALGEFEDKRGIDPLIERLSDRSAEVKSEAIRALKGHEDLRISEQMIKLLSEDSESVRSAAVLNIKERKDRRAIAALIKLLNNPDYFVPSQAAETLGLLGDKRAILPLIQVLEGKFDQNRKLRGDLDLRRSAIKSLGILGDREAVPVLVKCLNDKDPQTRYLAASAIRQIGDPIGLEAVKDIPEMKPPIKIGSATPVRPQNVKPPPPSAIPKGAFPGGLGYAVGLAGGYPIKEEKPPLAKEEKPAAIPTLPRVSVVKKYDIKPRPSIDVKPLITKLKDNDPRVRREMADSLGEAGDKEATEYLIPLLKDNDAYVRQAAARALGKLKDKKAVEALVDSLRDPEMNVRAFSAWALGEIGDPKAIEPLSLSLLDREKKIKEYSFEALRKYLDFTSRRVMVNTLIERAKKGHSDQEMMLRKLISLEGKDIILRALEDPQGNEINTLRNQIALMETRIHEVNTIAREALANHKNRTLVISELIAFVKREKSPYASISLLGQLQDPKGLPVLMNILKNRKAYDTFVVAASMNSIHTFGPNEEFTGILLDIIPDKKEPPGLRSHAIREMGKLGEKRALNLMIEILKEKKEMKEIRLAAASGLGEIKDEKAVNPLIGVLKDRDEDIWLRTSAATSLGNIGDERAIRPLQDSLQDPSGYIKNAAQTALRKIKGSP